MSRSEVVALASFSFLALVWSQVALGAGDAARGNTLYHSTYSCTDCHTGLPTQGNIVAQGATVNGLLAAINSVPEMTSRFLSTLGQNATDLADLAAYLASVTSPVATTPDINQQGLTGSWYEPATSGQGIELEIYPNLVAPGTALAFGAWFTFDSGTIGGAERQRWYTFDGNGQSGTSSIAITIYQNVGGNFDALPVTSSTVVGSGTLAFTDCTTGTFTYAFSDGSGRGGVIPLTRITPNVTCMISGVPTTNADFGFSGNWYNAATSGQGFIFELNPVAPVFFFTWFTYAPAGQASGAAGQRWYTGQATYTPGSRTIMATLYATTGGLFDQVTNPPPATVPVGTATVTFASCASAQLQFNFTGGSSAGKSGTIALTRLGPVPAGCGP